MRKLVDEAVNSGLVNAKPDPDGSPLTLFEYTPECANTGAWTPVTMACRGLVLANDGQVVARPFPKFFNLGERPETKLENLPPGVPLCTEKLDGSLVIVFRDPFARRWRAITRGSWTSVQARWAQAWLDNQRRRDIVRSLVPELTYCFELLAPWNRIVIPYEQEELVLLAAFDTESGVESATGVDGMRSVRMGYAAPGEMSADATGDRLVEGWVFRYPNGLRVKMKLPEYVRLHRIVTRCSERRLHEALAAGREPFETTAGLHDDFLAWYERTKRQLLASRALVIAAVDQVWEALPPVPGDRKASALAWQQFTQQRQAGHLMPLLFQRLDGKDWQRTAWKLVEPRGDNRYFTEGEDA